MFFFISQVQKPGILYIVLCYTSLQQGVFNIAVCEGFVIEKSRPSAEDLLNMTSEKNSCISAGACTNSVYQLPAPHRGSILRGKAILRTRQGRKRMCSVSSLAKYRERLLQVRGISDLSTFCSSTTTLWSSSDNVQCRWLINEPYILFTHYTGLKALKSHVSQLHAQQAACGSF